MCVYRKHTLEEHVQVSQVVSVTCEYFNIVFHYFVCICLQHIHAYLKYLYIFKHTCLYIYSSRSNKNKDATSQANASSVNDQSIRARPDYAQASRDSTNYEMPRNENTYAELLSMGS